MKTRNSLLLLSTASLFACSTLVGADFDDRNASGETTGGSEATSGGASAQGGQNAGGTQAKGGATEATGGSSSGGSTVLGSGGATGGSAGQTNNGGTSGSTATTGGSSTGGIGPAGNGGQGAEGGFGAQGGFGAEGGVGGETQGGAGGEPQVAGAGGEAGGGTPPGPAVVVLNEVKGQGSGDDFVEIYNLGPGNFNLEGYSLWDQSNGFIFPSGATIAEGGHVLLLLGQTAPVNGNYTCFTPNPCYHATWGVSQNGESVYFRGLQNQVLDQTAYPSQTGAGALTNDQTWGRLPSGTGAFRATRPTPEAINQSP